MLSRLFEIRKLTPRCRFLPRFQSLLVGFLAVLGALPATAQGPNISYVYTSNVGSGFKGANSVAVDSAGDAFVADRSLGSLYKETPNSDGTYAQSTISTSATNPIAVAIDSAGNLYVADAAHVYKETLAGSSYTESTIVTGLTFATSVAVDATDNVYVNDSGTGRVLLEKLSGTAYTQTVIASGLSTSGGGQIAVDATGNVYVCDPGNNRVLEETLAGGVYTQTVIVNNTTVVLDQVTNINTGSPFMAYGVAIDAFGNVLLSSQNYGIFKVVVNGTTYSLKNISLNATTPLGANGLAISPHGDLYLAATSAIDLLPAYELAESSSALNFGSVTLGTPATAAQTVTFKFDVGGTLASTPYAVSTQGDLTLDFQASSNQDEDVCVTGRTYNRGDICTVAATFSPTRPGARYGAIALFAPSGTPIATSYLQGVGVSPQVSFSPGIYDTNLGSEFSVVVAADSSNNFYDGYLTSFTNAHRPISVPTTNLIFTTGYPNYNFDYQNPGNGYGTGYVIDGAGNIVGSNALSGEISVGAFLLNPNLPMAANGNSLTGNYGPAFLAGVPPPPSSDTPPQNARPAIDGAGNLYFSDYNQNAILEEQYIHGWYNQQTVVATGLNNPGDVVVDAAGDVYAADTGNNRIVKETPNGDGTYTQTVVDSGFASPPEGLAIDRIGNLYVSLFNNFTNNNVPFIVKETLANDTYTRSNLIIPGSEGIDVNATGNVFVVLPASSSSTGESMITALDVSTPPSFTFASTAVGSTSTDSPQTLTILNNGNAPLTFTGTPTITAGFTLSSDSTCPEATLAPQASCTFNINFVPTQSGTNTGTLTITDNHLGTPGATQIIKLNGQGTGQSQGANPVLTPATINFGSLTVSSTSTVQTATLSNTGGVPQGISSFGFFGPNISSFSQTNNCGVSLAAGASCTISITCTPSATGALSANLGVNFPSPEPQESVALSCTGTAAVAPTAPMATLTPASANFGSVTSGTTSSAQTFTLSNPGNATLSISAMTLAGANASDFAFGTNTCGEALAASATCSIAITFTPSATGSFTATLSVADNAAGSPQTSALTGTGTVPPDFALVATPATQTVAPGGLATYTVSVSSTNGSFTNPVALTATGLPGGTITFSPASVTPGGSSAQSTMTVQTTTQLASGKTKHPQWPFGAPVFAALLLLLPGRKWRSRKLFLHLACLVALLGVAASTIACGGGFALPAKTYTLTVTGTSASDTHSTTVTLTVQ